LAFGGAVALDHHVDLANQAMLFVTASVLASIWLGAPASFAFALMCMLSLNWGFVPPRGSFTVDLERHAVLLGAMLLVCYAVDRRLYVEQDLGHWLTMRFRLSAVASMSCFIGAAGT